MVAGLLDILVNATSFPFKSGKLAGWLVTGVFEPFLCPPRMLLEESNWLLSLVTLSFKLVSSSCCELPCLCY